MELYRRNKEFSVTFKNTEDAVKFASDRRFTAEANGNICEVTFPIDAVGLFLATLKQYPILAIRENKMTLEKYFMNAYRNGGNR